MPRDLREILERALAEEPSQDTLNLYLPDIRAIIFNLLSGLKNKQISYKRLLADRQQPDAFPTPTPVPSRPPRAMSGSTEGHGSMGGSPASSSTHLPSGPRPPPSATALAERNQGRMSGARPAPPDAFRPTRTRSGESTRRDDGSISSHSQSSPVDTRRAPTPLAQPPSIVPPPAPTAGPSRPPARHPDRVSRDSFGNVTSRFSADSEASTSSAAVTAVPDKPDSGARLQAPKHSPSKRSPSPPPPLASPIEQPPVPILNLNSMPTDIPIARTPSPQPNNNGNDQAVRQSLALLQRSDALERRASKRFSSYTFNKMLPGSASPSTRKSQNGTSPQRPSRRSDRLPPMPSVMEDGTIRATPPDSSMAEMATPSLYVPTAPSSPIANSRGPEEVLAVPTAAPIAGTPAAPTGLGMGVNISETSGIVAPESNTSIVSTVPTSLTAFLQLGRQVKKATIELPLTMSALRLLFMERFEYDPGMEDFPDVYIRDNRTGVQYELEDMDDLKDGCVLTLDIERE